MTSPVAAAEPTLEPTRPTRRRGSVRERMISSQQAAGDDPLALALGIVGDRWSLAVVARLIDGPQRFNDLATAIAPIARTVLSDRLRRLEEAGVIARRQYSETPARWNYRLTVAGADLARVCGVLADWGSRHLGDGTPALGHAGCGGAITPVYSCETCGVIPARELAPREA